MEKIWIPTQENAKEFSSLPSVLYSKWDKSMPTSER
jgi:hypothetical protein